MTHAVRDDEALRAQFEQLIPQGNMAVVEASWVDGPHDFALAQIILKGTMPQGGMTYIGSLIVPFAACSWVIKMQGVEGSTRAPVKWFGWKSTFEPGGTSIHLVLSTDPPTPMTRSLCVGCPQMMLSGMDSFRSTR